MYGYLLHSRDEKLVFKPRDMQLSAYCDGSYALHLNARSHFGVCISVGGRYNAPFHNKSGLIKLMMRSSCEVEIVALNEFISDGIHYAALLNELGWHQAKIPVYEDNTAAISILTKGDFNYQNKGKHVKVKYEFFKQQLELDFIELVYCPTDEMLADVHTKNLTGSKSTLMNARLLGHPDAWLSSSPGVC
jgi:hypothetical protein